MSDRERELREEIERRLLALGARLPTSSLGRLGRVARRIGRGGEATLGLDDLTALVSSWGQLKGMAMKVGQLMSYLDLPLPQDVRAALAALQTHSPPMPFDRIAGILRAEFGQVAAPLLAYMDPQPAAAASIGQVHHALLPDGVDVAVKVQVPGVESAIAADFRSAAMGTSFVACSCPAPASTPSCARRAAPCWTSPTTYARHTIRNASPASTTATPRSPSPPCSSPTAPAVSSPRHGLGA